MKRLSSPVLATGGNRPQMARAQKPRNQAKTVAVSCAQLPIGAHGKDGVDPQTIRSPLGARLPRGGGFLPSLGYTSRRSPS
jgi:hypothetical protein